MAFQVRPMTAADLPQVGPLAQILVDVHHAFDQQRFMPLPNASKGYQGYFASQLDDAATVLFVAESEGKIVGYCYGRLEPKNYNALLDAAGWIHDVCVAPDGREKGVGEALVRRTVAELESRGAPRVLLSTATPNVAAQRLFARLGFRPTMIEMTRERGV